MRSCNDSRSYHVFNIDDLLGVVHVWMTPLGFGQPPQGLDDPLRVWMTPLGSRQGFFKIHIFSGGPDILHSMNYCSKMNRYYMDDYSRTS